MEEKDYLSVLVQSAQAAFKQGVFNMQDGKFVIAATEAAQKRLKELSEPKKEIKKD